MTTLKAVNEFLSSKTIAVVGASRNPGKFGTQVYLNLRKKGYRVFPVNPHADTVQDDRCYATLADLPEKVDGVVFIVKPPETEAVLQQALALGIRRFWMQQGAESPEAVAAAEQAGAAVVAGECILMYAAPVAFPHSMHRWIWKLSGKYAKN